MNVFRSLAEIPVAFGPSVVTIGNFDGLHVGHRRIMQRVCEIARADGLHACVLTFDPHPAAILAPHKAKLQMMTPALRVAGLKALGIDTVLLLPFSHEFARMTPAEFVDQVLVRGLGAKKILVGQDFRFGHKQSGDIETLRSLGAVSGFDVEPMGAVLLRGERVSSTAIRQHLLRGEVSRACRLLGHPYTLIGSVVSGQGIGSKQTVPTLNLAAENQLLPAAGVYVTQTRECLSKRKWKSITNVGTRPTFDGQGTTVETFLLDAFDGITPERIEVEFLRWIRAERRFDSPELLKAQIFKDVGVANRLHGRLSRLRVG